MWPCADNGSEPACVQGAGVAVRPNPTLSDVAVLLRLDDLLADLPAAPAEVDAEVVTCDECGRPVRMNENHRCPSCAMGGAWLCAECHDEVLRQVDTDDGGGAAALV